MASIGELAHAEQVCPPLGLTGRVTYRLDVTGESYIALICLQQQRASRLKMHLETEPDASHQSWTHRLSPHCISPPLYPAWHASRVSGASPARIPGWPLGHLRHSSSRRPPTAAQAYQQHRRPTNSTAGLPTASHLGEGVRKQPGRRISPCRALELCRAGTRKPSYSQLEVLTHQS